MAKLETAPDQVKVRMYRQGHGDCFLLALPRKGPGGPVYVLIDCGLKPGSHTYVQNGKSVSLKSIEDVVADIAEATGNHLDLVIVTHEHQDHLNGFWREQEPYFEEFAIDEAWMAWTENPNDQLANELRERYHDQLLSLVSARQKLAASPEVQAGRDPSVVRIDSLIETEIGEGLDSLPENVFAADNNQLPKIELALENSVNKQALKLIKDKARGRRGVRYLDPGGTSQEIEGSEVVAYVLGPPRDASLLRDEEPKGSEAFPDDNPHDYTFAAAARAQARNVDPETASASAEAAADMVSPFSPRFAVKLNEALNASRKSFFRVRYGIGNEGKNDQNEEEVRNNAPWRRIGDEWLYSAEALALKLNAGINNTSLVLAFELPNPRKDSRKVLLFTGDAQRGSWKSWSNLRWRDGEEWIRARDLLARTVLYKVGHHGSHNATLAGSESDKYANLSWMGTGAFAGEFAAMIPAVEPWANSKNRPPWVHPLPSIREALDRKAHGRVFQTDIAEPMKPDSITEDAWKKFKQQCNCNDLFFEYTIAF